MDILNLQVGSIDHTDTTNRTSGQTDAQFIDAATSALNVSGQDLVVCNVGEFAEEQSSPPVITQVFVKRASRQSDSAFKGDVSSAIKTAAGI